MDGQHVLYGRFKACISRKSRFRKTGAWPHLVWSIAGSDEAVLAFMADQVIVDTVLIANVSTWRSARCAMQRRASSTVSSSVLETFPRALLLLRNLRHLTIKSNSNIVTSALEWRNITQSLSPTLELLNLSFPHSLDALFDYDSQATPSDMKYIEKQYPRGNSPLIAFVTVLPNLRTLKIDDQYHQSLEIENEHLVALPPTLMCLRPVVSSSRHLSHSWSCFPGVLLILIPCLTSLKSISLS